MPTYTYDHIHLRSREPMETARYFNKMFDARIIETTQSDGQPRVDLDINGLTIFIARADENVPPGPHQPVSLPSIQNASTPSCVPGALLVFTMISTHCHLPRSMGLLWGDMKLVPHFVFISCQ